MVFVNVVARYPLTVLSRKVLVFYFEVCLKCMGRLIASERERERGISYRSILMVGIEYRFRHFPTQERENGNLNRSFKEPFVY